MADELADELELYSIPNAADLETIADGMHIDLTTSSIDHWSRWIFSQCEPIAKNGGYEFKFDLSKASKSENVYALEDVFDDVKLAFEEKNYIVTSEVIVIDDNVKPYDITQITIRFKSVA